MNLLLVVLDSVRAANCSLYGYPRQTTPTLESLADEATVYEQARAPSNWSLPSHVSLFTGLQTSAHRVTVHDALEPGHTVWDDFADAGYDTGLFTENGFVASHPAGLDEPFDTVVTVPDGEYPEGQRPDGFYYADAMLDWTSERDEWAACLNLMDAHRPYQPAQEYDHWGDRDARRLQADLPIRWEFPVHGGDVPYWHLSGLESLYDGGIRQADAVLGTVVERLRARGEYDDTLLIVCGDHGEGFGEFGRLSGQPRAAAHIVPTTESLLHVPLVVKRPRQREGRTVTDPAALTAIPQVANAAREGHRTTCAREQVLASKQPVTGELRRRYESAVTDPGPFFRESRVVYEQTPSGVRKTYSWGDAVGTVQVPRAGSVGQPSDRGRDRLSAAFRPVEAAGVRQVGRGEPADETKEQLAALGYF
ncbi:sulfatase [Halorientalis pallida]|uniref:Sulfatase n=1 Tax=Halorientalis pallida TaxID=2479928 RepID=A0A498KUS1_9EURY|nr:sulfatase [Halorientalis pallida]RXK47994.1 sulfatase [Halorientalis pallida]